MLSPTVIMPIFMWNYISPYLSKHDLYTLGKTDSRFNVIYNLAWKHIFDNRRESIAIVKCKSRDEMDHKNFWRKAAMTYAHCMYFHDVFRLIEAENKSRMKTIEMVHYKVFIKGPKDYDPYKCKCYHFYSRCGIEIIGNNKKISLTKVLVNALQYLVLTNIKFDANISLHNYDIDQNHFEVPFIKPDTGELCITNCSFGKSQLRINNIMKVTITNCVFNHTIIDLCYYYASVNGTRIDYKITNNTFINKKNTALVSFKEDANNLITHITHNRINSFTMSKKNMGKFKSYDDDESNNVSDEYNDEDEEHNNNNDYGDIDDEDDLTILFKDNIFSKLVNHKS